jgi:hypothetical protein
MQAPLMLSTARLYMLIAKHEHTFKNPAAHSFSGHSSCITSGTCQHHQRPLPPSPPPHQSSPHQNRMHKMPIRSFWGPPTAGQHITHLGATVPNKPRTERMP